MRSSHKPTVVRSSHKPTVVRSSHKPTVVRSTHKPTVVPARQPPEAKRLRALARSQLESYGARMRQLEVTVRSVAPKEFAVLERLWVMFHHDLSEFRGRLPERDGPFHNDRLRAAVNDPAWAAYLFWAQNRPVGLAMVRALDQPVRVLNAFFIVRGLRRAGVGSGAVRQVLLRHPDTWEVPFQDDNETAVHFWRRTARAMAGDSWTEERRAVLDRPDLAPDVWISFATEDTL